MRPHISTTRLPLLTVVVSTVLALNQAAVQPTPAQSAVVRFTIASRSAAWSLAEPITADLTVSNEGQESVVIDLGNNRRTNISFIVTDPHGLTTEASIPTREGISRVGKVTLPANQTLREELILSEWYPFDKVGRYLVSGRIRIRQAARPQKIATFNVRVLPRDVARLETVCQELTSIVLTGTATEALGAARRLSYVLDPVAIPFFEEVLARNRVARHDMFSGLARIGDARAIDVLARAARDDDAEVRGLAVFHLTELAQHTRDATLLRRIKSALEPGPGRE